MKRLFCVLAIIATVLSGCATLDRADLSMLEQHHVSPTVYDKMAHDERLDLPDIIELSKRKVPDSFTLRYLRSTYAVYQLDSEDVLHLRRAGVSREIIDYLLSTPSKYGVRSYPYPYPGYPYDPYYYPYPYYYDYPPVIIERPYRHHWRGW